MHQSPKPIFRISSIHWNIAIPERPSLGQRREGYHKLSGASAGPFVGGAG
uniref:Uncharacterized protein n=1 Tax=Picea sitchensis TaxID=3332 RepID=A9NM23_PICSI|nr:unknown [Picea sitchensis]